MPSGSVTLLEAAKAGDDTLKRGVVETIIQESPILARLPMITIEGNALKHMEESTLPTPEFRQVNSTYSRSFGADTEHFWGTTILGGEVFVDNYIVKTRGNLRDVKATQFQKMAKAMALTFDENFINGDGTSNTFKGVKQLISEGFGFEQETATNGGPITLNQLDEAHDLLRTGTADAILCNRTHRRKITHLARDHSSHPLIDVGTDALGRKVTMYDGVELNILGDDASGNQILAFDETQGSSNVTSSMYFVRYGTDENVCGLMGAGGSFEVRDFGEQEAAPGHMGRVEVYPGVCIFNKYSIARYKGITNA